MARKQRTDFFEEIARIEQVLDQLLEAERDAFQRMRAAPSGPAKGAALSAYRRAAAAQNHRWLFAVNAGSNDISSFAVTRTGLVLVDKVDSGGIMPVSVTSRRHVLCVLNAGGTGNIAGFALLFGGHLVPIAGSKRPLSANDAGAAQVGFDRDGDLLVVTEKNTNRIDLYTVEGGRSRGPRVRPSNGVEPFGFAFDQRGDLIVSEAVGGAASAARQRRHCGCDRRCTDGCSGGR